MLWSWSTEFGRKVPAATKGCNPLAECHRGNFSICWSLGDCYAHLFCGVRHGTSSKWFSLGSFYYYIIQIHHLTPLSVLHIAVFVHFCKAFLGIEQHFELFRSLYVLFLQPSAEEIGLTLAVWVCNCVLMQLRGIWNGLQSRLILTRRTIGFILEIHLLLCPCGLLSHPCTSASGSKVIETARVPAGTEAQWCYRRREHCPRESVAAWVLTVVKMLPTEFNSSKVTETARVPAGTEAWRCYRRWEHRPKESKAARATCDNENHTTQKQ